jgi:hypothetical protein
VRVERKCLIPRKPMQRRISGFEKRIELAIHAADGLRPVPGRCGQLEVRNRPCRSLRKSSPPVGRIQLRRARSASAFGPERFDGAQRYPMR